MKIKTEKNMVLPAYSLQKKKLKNEATKTHPSLFKFDEILFYYYSVVIIKSTVHNYVTVSLTAMKYFVFFLLKLILP